LLSQTTHFPIEQLSEMDLDDHPTKKFFKIFCSGRNIISVLSYSGRRKIFCEFGDGLAGQLLSGFIRGGALH